MTVRSATRLGPYEVLSSVGAGAMGEVYRARDPRLGREVAVKVLPESFSSEPQRLRRFEQEARAAASLNHPNLLAVYDIGEHEGAPYIVSELLEGETLREKLAAGPIPLRKAVDYALQLARGLGAAHEKGIVHRDLKPENIFVTRDGRVKILDFGLAKLIHPEAMPDGVTATIQSDAGTVVGTVGYMAPEQVRGKPADARTDLFALGAILYEMLTGKRAFQGDTSADTMTAILTKDPPEFGSANAHVSPALDRIVRHCLEKSPEERFQSARDVAFDLETLSSMSGSNVTLPAAKVSWWRRRAPLLAVALVVVLAALAGVWAGMRSTSSAPLFTRLTYRGGFIVAARFSADGQTILYSAGFGGDPVQIYTTRPEATQSRELGFKRSSILAISKSDEMLITLGHHAIAANGVSGTLAQAPLTGGAPREMMENVRYADWSPDGSKMAVVRGIEGKEQLEYPLGKVLYATSDGWISDARISPDGSKVAFIDHPVRYDSRGWIAMVDTQGKKTRLSQFYSNALGLAWHPSGKEVWFTASAVHLSSNLMAVTPSGKERLVWAGAGGVILNDISSDGRVLLSRQNRRRGIAGLFPGQDHETDLSWLDWSLLYDISPDGKWIIFAEEGDAAGPKYSAYMRATDGSPAIRLGDGIPLKLSPNGNWVSALIPGDTYELAVMPTRAGEARNLSAPGMDYRYAFWTRDGTHLVVLAKQAGHGERWWLQGVSGGPPRPLTPEGAEGGYYSVGENAVVARENGKLISYSLDTGKSSPLAIQAPDLDWNLITTDDSEYVYVMRDRDLPQKVDRWDPATGKVELWKEFMPADKAGVYSVGPFAIAPGGKWYAYSYVRDLSDLYMVEGLK